MAKVVTFRQYLVCTGVALCLSLAGNAAVAEPGKDAKDMQVSNPAPPAFVYKPPLRGAPKARVGGGTRGTGTQHVVLQVLAPDHAGLTAQAQPALYWYVESPVAARFEIALIDEDGIDPLLELEIDRDVAAGIQRLDLKEHAISLQTGIAYQWSVALVRDESSRSTDIVSSGVIERVEPDAALGKRIDASSGTDLVALYAGEGIWYDALDKVSDMIAAAPGDDSLVSIRESLLGQIGLPAAVD